MNVLDQCVTANFAAYHGDCCEVMREIPTNSIHYSAYSPPFSSMFCYNASERDAGNVKDDREFFEHFSFLMPELFRVTMPGRLMSAHVMDLPTSKVKDGYIGLKDFPGDFIRAAQAAGWVWHSRVVIWKCPVSAVTRTKALGLLHKQLLKDSGRSRMGIPDQVLTFRKPGDNPEPMKHTKEEFPIPMWQKWASPVWMDIDPSDTLQYRSVREHADDRHIAPLQKEVVRRCVKLWSNPGDTVLSPFGGIGTEIYVSLEEGRKGILVELKKSYFDQAVANLRTVEPNAPGRQVSLFDLASKESA